MVPYDDPHYRRKNLSILSLIFIIYILAGGSIANEKYGHTLPFLNITLERPWVVVAIASIILIWFAVRYWQTEPAQGTERPETTIQQAGFKWCKTYCGGEIDDPNLLGPNRKVAKIVPQAINIRTLRPWKLLQTLKEGQATLYDPDSRSYYGGPAKADEFAAKIYSKPSFFQAALLGWRIRREALTQMGIYDDWLIPWALFILATSLTVVELIFAALNASIST